MCLSYSLLYACIGVLFVFGVGHVSEKRLYVLSEALSGTDKKGVKI